MNFNTCLRHLVLLEMIYFEKILKVFVHLYLELLLGALLTSHTRSFGSSRHLFDIVTGGSCRLKRHVPVANKVIFTTSRLACLPHIAFANSHTS